MGRYSVGTNCCRVIFILINIIFLILGVGIAGVGSWLIYLGEQNDYSVLTGHTMLSGAALLLTAGVITLIISGVGIFGALAMWRPLLFIYILLVIFAALVEIAAGITGFVLRDEIGNQVKVRMYMAIEDYRASSSDPDYRRDVKNVVGYVQNTFECCGVNSSIDWFMVNLNTTQELGGKPPPSCDCTVGRDSHCENFNLTIIPPGTQNKINATYEAWNRGCLSYVRDNLNSVAISIGIVGFVVAATELLGVAMAVGLFVCIAKRSNYTYV